MTADASFQTRLDLALTGVKVMMANFGVSAQDAVNSPFVAEDLRQHILAQLNQEQSIRIVDPLMVVAPHTEWLADASRSHWYYWPRLKAHLLTQRNWPEPTVRSIDQITDRILGSMENPVGDNDFDTRGLVVGYVQSGKTANYSALIAKAVDAGYRLVIVLTGIHNTLRLQTQRRLDAELVGKVKGRWGGVGRPAPNREWLTFTRPTETGDFNPGYINAAALSAERPSMMVIKKNGTVLKNLINWLKDAPEETRSRIPVMIIDDEADQASINTGGNRTIEDIDQVDDSDEESPTTINLRIRELLKQFSRRAYVAYTATPFANVLIDHKAIDREGGVDLYPRSFIVSLPRPDGYYGAERIFGKADGSKAGMDVIEVVPDSEIPFLVPSRRNEIPDFEPKLTVSLLQAVDDFILAGAARIQRGAAAQPATMLIHTSYSNTVQQRLSVLIKEYAGQLKGEWSFGKRRKEAIIERLGARWEDDFRAVTRSENLLSDVPFSEVEPHILPFLKKLQVLEINHTSEQALDYERDPDLKVIVVGGNRLSRGLTLEGLLVSFFVRATRNYDTLMQMGRWFGYRDGYADLTRIYTTSALNTWFRDLAVIEAELRDEIARYEHEHLTPLQLGVKIRRHPSMLITSPLKLGAGEQVQVSFAGQAAQTIMFPFNDYKWLEGNIDATRRFLAGLAAPDVSGNRPVWLEISQTKIMRFLEDYQTDPEANQIRTEFLREYIAAQLEHGELTNWVVGVMGREKSDPTLGTLDLHVAGHPSINLIERTRLSADSTSVGVIMDPKDAALGLSQAQRQAAEDLHQQLGQKLSIGRALRKVRSQKQGLLLVYPISQNSGHGSSGAKSRTAIYPRPNTGRHVIGISLVFPDSETAASVEYTIGSVGTGNW